MTGKISGTVSSAENAAYMRETKVTVVDSMSISKALRGSGRIGESKEEYRRNPRAIKNCA